MPYVRTPIINIYLKHFLSLFNIIQHLLFFFFLLLIFNNLFFKSILWRNFFCLLYQHFFILLEETYDGDFCFKYILSKNDFNKKQLYYWINHYDKNNKKKSHKHQLVQLFKMKMNQIKMIHIKKKIQKKTGIDKIFIKTGQKLMKKKIKIKQKKMI